MSFFESNIRHLGGLLSTYQLTGDILFLQKAETVAKVLEFSFGTVTQQEENHGLPYAKLNLQKGYAINNGWARYCFVLAEFGTIALEWSTLAAETGEKRYMDYVTTLNNYLRDMAPPESGAWSNSYNGNTMTPCTRAASFGGPGDSFYEYILKFYLLSGRKDQKQLDWLKNTTTMIKGSLLYRQDNEKVPVMMVELDSRGNQIHKMGHLACFSGGFWILGSSVLPDEMEENVEIAEGVTQSCHESYVASATGIGPEAFDKNGQPIKNAAYYILRPETIESYFYMYRLTKDNKYRDWAWEFVLALEKSCRAPFGYAGLKDVNTGEKNDAQESFFLAETLK